MLPVDLGLSSFDTSKDVLNSAVLLFVGVSGHGGYESVICYQGMMTRACIIICPRCSHFVPRRVAYIIVEQLYFW